MSSNPYAVAARVFAAELDRLEAEGHTIPVLPIADATSSKASHSTGSRVSPHPNLTNDRSHGGATVTRGEDTDLSATGVSA